MKEIHKLQIIITILLATFLMPLTSTARFSSIDPEASSYPSVSPYVYTLNNPLKFIDPDGRKVRYAPKSYDPGPQYKQAFGEAVQYLNKYGLGGPLAKLEKSEKVFYLTSWNEGMGSGSLYFPNPNGEPYGTIHWDFRNGLVWESGSQSASMGLYEESVHATHDLDNRQQFNKDLQTPDTDWNNVEEKKTAQDVNRAAVKAGESPRTTHRQGRHVPVNSPTELPPPPSPK